MGVNRSRQTYIVPDDVDVVRASVVTDLLETGDSIASIAKTVGVTPQTIHNVLRRMGYTYSRTKGWRRV